jgi:uncharacterized heparinase superfamily protein
MAWPERAKSALVAARRILAAVVYATPLYRLTLAGGVPATVRPMAADPWAGDAAAGTALADGARLPGGRQAVPGEDPWTTVGGDAAAHGFAWLADLRAAGSAAARLKARHLVGGWMASHGGWGLPAWRPDIVGRRLSHWLAAHAFLCDGADAGFTGACLVSLTAQARHLGRVAGAGERDAGAFAVVKGLVDCALYLPGRADRLAGAVALLEREIERQVLPDGGHVQRNPALHLAVLKTLIGIRGGLAGDHAEVPTALRNAIDRMAPMLRALRLGDGGLVQFNGGGPARADEIDTVLAQAGAMGRAPSGAPHSGFQRLTAARTVVVVDAGKPPAGPGAAAGSLAFEMSSGRHRLVINCGPHPDDDEAWRDRLRGTAAHSTVSVDDRDSATIVRGGVRRGPSAVAVERRQADGNTWLDLSHDGYAASFGLVHERRLYLAASGDDLRGEDRLVGGGGRAFAVRFHLHPSLQASMNQARTTVLLKPPSGRGWQVQAAGGALGLEESVTFDGGTRKRTSQIVVSGPLQGDGATVKWRFSRLGD